MVLTVVFKLTPAILKINMEKKKKDLQQFKWKVFK